MFGVNAEVILYLKLKPVESVSVDDADPVAEPNSVPQLDHVSVNA